MTQSSTTMFFVIFFATTYFMSPAISAPVTDANSVDSSYKEWAINTLKMQCGLDECDLRHQYCDSVMDVCRPCTELCRTWDDESDVNICKIHCSAYLGFKSGGQQQQESTKKCPQKNLTVYMNDNVNLCINNTLCFSVTKMVLRNKQQRV